MFFGQGLYEDFELILGLIFSPRKWKSMLLVLQF